MGRVVGIDYGLARIGVSISDEMRLIARTLCVVQADRSMEGSAQRVLHALQSYDVARLVLGLPLHMDGSQGTSVQQVHLFKSALEASSGLEVVLWDERLTTVMAERTMRQAEMSRKKRQRVVDAVAAVILLQGYLDSLGQTFSNSP